MQETTTLPRTMRSWIEEVAGSPVSSATRQAGGGRNEGWLVELDTDHEPRRLFLRWDRSDPAATGDPWTVRREAEVYRALSPTDVPVAAFVAVHPTAQALLLGVVDGDGRFSLVRDPATAESIAKDFMLCLAALHRLDPMALGLADTGTTVADHVRGQLDEMEEVLAFRGGVPTAELAIALRWLRDNIPYYDGPPVLVQGDTGPGNFMFRGERVAAIVDWELAHPGDPMDDLAWVSLRSTQEPFPDLEERFAEYERASGNRIDVDRIRYYRVLAEAKIATMGHGRGAGTSSSDADDSTPDGEAGAARDSDKADGGDVGARLIFGQLHRRLLVESLGAAMGIDVDMTPADSRGEADHEWSGLYDVVLDQLRDVITPRISDGFAVQRTKGLARVIRYLEAVDRHGRAFADAELADLGTVLGVRPSSPRSGRRDLAVGVRDGTIDPVDALHVVGRRVARDEELLRASSGALAGRHYDPLTRFAGER